MRTDSNASLLSENKSRGRSSRYVSPLRSRPTYNYRRSVTEKAHKWTPPNVQATNFQTVHYRMPISGTYVIDPSLEMPADLIQGNPTEKSNLSIECSRGSITADIWLVDEPTRTGVYRGLNGKRTIVDVHCKSWMGRVNMNLYSLSTQPFLLSVSSNGGDISIALPPDFVGPITLSTGSVYDLLRPSSFTPFAPSGVRENQPSASAQSGTRTVPFGTSIVFSAAVQSRLANFSEADGKRTCFIGDYRSAGYTTRKEWTGSMVDVESSYGNLKISFLDEQMEQEQGSGCTVM